MKITRIERARFTTDRTNREKGKPPIWLVGITDLTTLLLAFFIMLFATTQPRTMPVIQATESLRTQFSGTQDSTNTKQLAGHEQAKRNWESLEHDPGLELRYLYSLIRNYTQSAPELDKVTLWQSHNSIVLSIPSELYFQPGEAALSGYGKSALREVASLLSSLPNVVQVIGHADTTPVSGDRQFRSNWHLSLARAYSVTQALQDAGYTHTIETRGRGTADADVAPWTKDKDLSESQLQQRARRVDIHVSLLRS